MSDPNNGWSRVSDNPGSDDAREVVNDRTGENGEVVNGNDIRDGDGNSIDTWNGD